MNKPLVSIASITYNHEHFIEQAIQSWLMQKPNFEIEIVIFDYFILIFGIISIFMSHFIKYIED